MKFSFKNTRGFLYTFIIFTIAMILGLFLITYLNGILKPIAIIILSFLTSYILCEIFRIRSLEKIKNYIKSLKDMDLVAVNEEAIPVDIKNELDALAKKIKENLKNQVKISTDILNVCESLNTVSMDSLTSTEMIASSVEVADKNTMEQANMLMDSNELANGLTESLEEVEKEIIDKSQFISESITSAQKSMKNIENIGNRIQNSKNMAQNTLQQIQKLDDYSDEIVNLIDLINSISKETNMLSLNASIEAARAGEEGRGFAVVAMEVGKLANETAQASSRIEEVINTLKQDISTARQFMEDEMEYMEENWQVMRDINKEFQSIIERLNIGKESLEEITAVIEENNDNIEKITHNIDRITSFSQEIASRMGETSAQVLEQYSRARNLQQIAADMREHVFGMQQAVAGQAMENIMLEKVEIIKDYAMKKDTLDEKDIEKLIEKTGVDAIFITDPEGNVIYTNEKVSLGLNLYEADSTFLDLKEGKKKHVATPIKTRVDDGRLFKFLAVADEAGRLYEVGLSLDSLMGEG